MKYLLSDGRTTTDKVAYIKDIIRLNMLLLPDEVPYFSGGSSELVTDVLADNLQSHIAGIVKQVITRVQSLVPSVAIQQQSILIDNNSIKINISIGGTTETYEIKGNN